MHLCWPTVVLYYYIFIIGIRGRSSVGVSIYKFKNKMASLGRFDILTICRKRKISFDVGILVIFLG